MRKAMSSPEDVMDAGLSEKEERATREKEDQLFSIKKRRKTNHLQLWERFFHTNPPSYVCKQRFGLTKISPLRVAGLSGIPLTFSLPFWRLFWGS